MTQIQAGRYT